MSDAASNIFPFYLTSVILPELFVSLLHSKQCAPHLAAAMPPQQRATAARPRRGETAICSSPA